MRIPAILSLLAFFALLSACSDGLTGNVIASPGCPTSPFMVRGTSMEPALHDGQEVQVLTNSSCYALGRGDIVLYDYAGNDVPVVKRVMAVPGDAWRLDGGSIVVNGAPLVNTRGEAYALSQDGIARLSRYAEQNPVLEPQTYLLLAEIPSGSMDSTRYGLVHGSDIVGKVIG